MDYYTSDDYTVCELLDASVVLASEHSAYGAVSAGTLRLRGQLRRVAHTEMIGPRQIELEPNSRTFTPLLHWDIATPSPDAEVYCLCLCKRARKLEECRFRLLLNPTDTTKGEYSRVGYFEL